MVYVANKLEPRAKALDLIDALRLDKRLKTLDFDVSPASLIIKNSKANIPTSKPTMVTNPLN